MSQEETTRQKIHRILEMRPETFPTAISDALDDESIKLSPGEVIDEIVELNKSIDEQIKVAPPVCNNCGFEKFEELANIPSSCPECRSEWIKEPKFKIE